VKERIDICIVGAGLGGLAAGALLSQKGYNVEIFEKEKILGGRALSLDGNKLTLEEYISILHRFETYIPFSVPSLEEIFEKRMLEGYQIDLGFHLLESGSRSTIGRVMKKLGEEIDISGTRLGYIENEKFVFPFISCLSPIDILRAIPRTLFLLFARPPTLAALDKVPMSETIEKYGKGKLGLGLELISRLITTVNDLCIISTGETFRVMRNLLHGEKAVGYPRKGIGTLAENFAAVVKKQGGKIHLGRKVEKIMVNDGIAKGIIVEGEMKEFDVIISNVPIQNLFSIVPEKKFPPTWVKKIKGLKGTGSLCAYYSLKKVDSKLVGKSLMFIERDIDIEGGDALGMIDFQTADPHTRLSPKNRYLIQAYIICSPEEARNDKKVEMLRNILDKWVEKTSPNFMEDMDWAIYPTTWHLDGVAKTIDNEKPPSKTPIKNLYLVGDCVASTGVGMNCAVDSAIHLVQIEINKNS
jgi:hypothetical protein